MDKSRILNIITEAESKLVTLDEALDSGNSETANWIFLILSGVFQDLQRLTEEEPIPIEIDKQKLSMTFRSALDAVREGEAGIEEREYHLMRSDAVLLCLALHDIREIITATSQ